MFKKLRSIFGSKKPTPPTVSLGYDLEAWNASPDFAIEFGKLLRGPVFSAAYSVMVSQIPTGYPIRGDAVTDIQAAIELGRVNGYIEAVSLLKTLGKPKIKHEPIEQDYGANIDD